MSADPHETRHITWWHEADPAATVRSNGTYPRDELEFGQLDRWDRRPELAPRPIRNPARTARWVRLGLLLVAAGVLGALIGWFGVPGVPR